MAPVSPRKLSERSAVSEAMPKALRSYIPPVPSGIRGSLTPDSVTPNSVTPN